MSDETEKLQREVEETGKNLARLEKDLDELREAIRSTINWRLSDPEVDDIKAWELRDKLAEWAGESEETDTF